MVEATSVPSFAKWRWGTKLVIARHLGRFIHPFSRAWTAEGQPPSVGEPQILHLMTGAFCF
eukprot:3162240-Pyramimonas_sp.AAC.1